MSSQDTKIKPTMLVSGLGLLAHMVPLPLRALGTINGHEIRYICIANKNKRLLIKENVFLDLFAMVFKELNLNGK